MPSSLWTPASGLHRNIDARSEHPHSVLVFAVLFQNFVWVRHPNRGWEVPGGKIEVDETPEDAVYREAYEEAGLLLEQPLWIAEYFVDTYEPKWVYLAKVMDVRARPNCSEIIDVGIFHPVMHPTVAKSRFDVSPIMKDDVYEKLWPALTSATSRIGGEIRCL